MSATENETANFKVCRNISVMPFRGYTDMVNFPQVLSRHYGVASIHRAYRKQPTILRVTSDGLGAFKEGANDCKAG